MLIHVAMGAVLVGGAVALLFALTGRVVSVAGMLNSLLGGGEGLAASSIAFLAGVFMAPVVWGLLGGADAVPSEVNRVLLVLGGLLIGVGARLSKGGAVQALSSAARGSGWGRAALGAVFAGVALALVVLRVTGLGGPA